MYNVQKMLTLDSNPLIRLEKRLTSLKHTHEAGLSRCKLLTENNLNSNRQLMESLMLRLHSIDPKSKKNKRIANRVKTSSPKRMRSVSGKPQEMFNPNYSAYSTFQAKIPSMKRVHQLEFCENPTSTFLKDLKELPPLHPYEVETVLRKKEDASRNAPRKDEPIFPPPSEPSCVLAARSNVVSAGKAAVSSAQLMCKGSQAYNQPGPSSDKYSLPSTSCINSFNQGSRSNTLPPHFAAESYPYIDLRSKYGADCYHSGSVCYDQFGLPGFSNEYPSFNTYSRPSGYATWNVSRVGQTTSPLVAPDGAGGYRSYTSASGLEGAPGFSTNLPFSQPFQGDNFTQSVPPYPSSSVDHSQPSYGMNLSSYNYPPPPPNTTSYM